MFAICAKTNTTEHTQSEGKPDLREKMNKGAEDFKDNIRGKSRRRDRSHGRRRKRSMNRSDGRNLESSKGAQPSFASFSPHWDLLCDEPEVMTEVQDMSQEKKQLENLKSEELKDLKSELQTVSETHTLLHMEGAALVAHTKAEQLEADLVFERAEVRKLREQLEEKDREAKKTLESTQASHQLQTEKQKEETRKMAAALRKAEDLLETERYDWQKEKISLIQDAKEAVERSQASHQAQLEEHREETRKITAALEEAEDLLETERFCRQQEKISLLEEMEESKALYELQLDEHKCNIETLADALMSLTQKFEGCQVEWYEEKTSLIQTTEGLKKTVQDMQQEAKGAVERSQASHQAQLEKHREETRKIAAALEEAEDLLETECFCRQQEKISLLEEMEESKALYELQLDEHKCNIETLADALMSLTQKFEGCQVEWYEEKTSLIQTTEILKKTVQDMQQEAKEAVERAQASHQAALKEAEDLLETERLCWQQEKISLLEIEKFRDLFEDQLEEQNHENKTLAAALWDVEQKLESHQMEWQEENTFLTQATDCLKETLQEWEEEERFMKSQLEDLMSKKKKKKKWYRRIFCLA